MRMTILKTGIIAGAIAIGGIMLSLMLSKSGGSMQFLENLGYLIMFVAFSLIFIAVKRHRDEDLGGHIRFGTAFSLGLGITLVASVVYVLVWEVNLVVTDYAFINEYADSIVADAREAGSTPEQLATLNANMEEMKANYANPLFRLPITFLEIFPVGLLISLISALILRKSDVLPAQAA